MRTRLLLALLMITGSCSIYGYHFSGHSFFTIRTPFQTASPEKEALWHYDMLDKKDDHISGSLEIVPFGGKYIEHQRGLGEGDGLGQFFAPYGKAHLDVIEFKPTVPSSGDLNRGVRAVEARNFNIQTRSKTRTFRSKLHIQPHHTFVGVGFAYRQRVWDCWWVDISAPVEHVKNRVDLNERIIDTGGGPVKTRGLNGQQRFGSVTEAFTHKGMQFALIDSQEHKKTGLADIEVKIGWDGYNNGEAHFRSYIGGVFPTGNKPDPRFLFAPVIGNNKHFGVMFGGNIGFQLCAWGDHLFRHEIDTMGRYLFPNHQVRSTDLRDKEWSRYIESYDGRKQAKAAFDHNDPNSGSFGINAFTSRVKVSPRFATTFNTAFIYEYCDYFNAEAGYNFYARQGEQVEFVNFDTNAALKSIHGKGQTSQARTIGKDFPQAKFSFRQYKGLSIDNFDPACAAHPPTIEQTLYGALGYRCQDFGYPTSFSVGGSYAFSHSNAGLRRWMVWGKAAIDF